LEAVEYPHPLLEESLSETYGVILYQEQVMQCAARLAGYTLGEADLLRRAMGKKKVEVMAEQRAKFVDGAEKNGVPGTKAAEIFNIIEKFAGYGFNKSHSAAYALISYQTAYLKAHYGPEFLAAYLSALVGSKMDVLGRYIGEVRGLGIQVAAPDINRSKSSFSVWDGVILFGFSAISKAGSTAVESILRARAAGPFKSLWDFVSRVDLRTVNRAVMENLVKSGAFAGIEPNRRKLLESLQGMIEIASRKGGNANQRTLFDDMEDEEPQMSDVADYEQRKLLDLEKESVGIYISGHPYDEYRTDEYRYATCSVSDLVHWRPSCGPAVILGLLSEFREKYTKKGDSMGILLLENSDSQVEIVCFPRQWSDVKPILVQGAPYIVTGTVRNEGDVSIILDEIEPLSEVRERGGGAVRIKVATEGLPEDFYNSLHLELGKYPGDMSVMLDLETPEVQALLKMKAVKVSMVPGLAEGISDLSGGRASVVNLQR
jgi:DNA polymerase-3 subunit alpha